MKETVLDVLMYLFDNYIEDDVEFTPDEDVLRVELKEAGFGEHQVSKAFDWLEGLAEGRPCRSWRSGPRPAFSRMKKPTSWIRNAMAS